MNNDVSRVVAGGEFNYELTALANRLRSEGQNVIGFGAVNLILIPGMINRPPLKRLMPERVNTHLRLVCLNLNRPYVSV